MGGYGSGRRGGWLTTEDGLSMSLSKLLRDRLPARMRVGRLARMDRHDDP
jgi:hypothetical protein